MTLQNRQQKPMVPLAGGTAGVRAVCTPRRGMSPVRHIGQILRNDTVPSEAAASLSSRDSALVAQKGKASEMSGLAAGQSPCKPPVEAPPLDGSSGWASLATAAGAVAMTATVGLVNT